MAVKTKAFRAGKVAHYLVSGHSYEQTAIVAVVWALKERKVMVPSSANVLMLQRRGSCCGGLTS